MQALSLFLSLLKTTAKVVDVTMQDKLSLNNPIMIDKDGIVNLDFNGDYSISQDMLVDALKLCYDNEDSSCKLLFKESLSSDDFSIEFDFTIKQLISGHTDNTKQGMAFFIKNKDNSTDNSALGSPRNFSGLGILIDTSNSNSPKIKIKYGNNKTVDFKSFDKTISLSKNFYEKRVTLRIQNKDNRLKVTAKTDIEAEQKIFEEKSILGAGQEISVSARNNKNLKEFLINKIMSMNLVLGETGYEIDTHKSNKFLYLFFFVASVGIVYYLAFYLRK